MNVAATQKLERLAQALNDLPEETQADVLADWEAQVENLTAPRLTDEQVEIVRQRMAAPRVYVSNEDIEALMRRYEQAP